MSSNVAVVGSSLLKGFCSHCHKVWTLETAQGVCQWCGKLATLQTSRTPTLRSIKSNGRYSRKQDDHKGNGYDQLNGEWLTYYKVADRYAHRARPQDREDLLHTIIANLADAGRSNGHKPDNQSWMYRIASFTVAQYWRDYYRQTNGLDCGHCSNRQRKKCKESFLYSHCPKAVKVESLYKPIIDSEGNLTELGELIADDKALDLADWLDYKTFLLTCPDRLITIAGKIQQGEALANADMIYLCRWRQREQKFLF